ncbi:MAG: hypothetical protein GY719_42635 [bacterium]|nr:hypothetical protein [bacterium]
MRKIFLTVLAFLLTAAQAMASDYQIIGTTTSQDGALVRTEATVQVGENPLDQFKMIRLVKDDAIEGSRGSILLLPPAGFSFTFYELRDVADSDDENGDSDSSARDSIAEILARRGYDVYGYSPRVDGIPAGSCEAGVLDCSAMAHWGLRSMVEDAAFIREWIEQLQPGSPVVIGGASLGAMQAIATVNSHPEKYDGTIVWEGSLYSEDPGVVAQSEAYCVGLGAAVDAGIVFDGVTFNVFQQLGKQVNLAPSGLTPNPLFPPVLTNHQSLVVALALPTPGPLSMPVPGYILANGTIAKEFGLFFASDARLVASAERLYDYFPLAVLRDLHCSYAGIDDQFVDGLGSFTGPVLAIGAGHGYGPYLQDQLDRFGSREVELRVEPDFGHLDHFWSDQHRAFVERPVLRWLRRTLR